MTDIESIVKFMENEKRVRFEGMFTLHSIVKSRVFKFDVFIPVEKSIDYQINIREVKV